MKKSCNTQDNKLWIFFGEMRGLNGEELVLYNEAREKDNIVYDINFGWLDNMEEFFKMMFADWCSIEISIHMV